MRVSIGLLCIGLTFSVSTFSQELYDVIASVGYGLLGNTINNKTKHAGKHIANKELDLDSPLFAKIVSLDSKTLFNGLIKEGLADPGKGFTRIIPYLYLPATNPKTFLKYALTAAVDSLKSANANLRNKYPVASIDALLKDINHFAEQGFKVKLMAAITNIEQRKIAPSVEANHVAALAQLKSALGVSGRNAVVRTSAFNAGLRFISIQEFLSKMSIVSHEWQKLHSTAKNTTLPASEQDNALQTIWQEVYEDPDTVAIATHYYLISHLVVLLTQVVGDIFVQRVTSFNLDNLNGKLTSTAVGMMLSYGLKDTIIANFKKLLNDFELYDSQTDDLNEAAYIAGIKGPFAWLAIKALWEYSEAFGLQLLAAGQIDPDKIGTVQRAFVSTIVLSFFAFVYYEWDAIYAFASNIQHELAQASGVGVQEEERSTEL